ncbi:hypothetical protein ACJW30_11G020300 [Castanea mollissima]
MNKENQNSVHQDTVTYPYVRPRKRKCHELTLLTMKMIYIKNTKHTSVLIPSANDNTAAMIKMIRFKTCQASQRNLCRKIMEHGNKLKKRRKRKPKENDRI